MNTKGGTHLSKDDRNKIFEELAKNSSCKEIARIILRDERTVSKEIKKRRNKEENGRYKLTNQPNKECKRLLRFPYVCNGCKTRRTCKIRYQYLYDPDIAQENYKIILSSSREGINMTLEEKAEFDSILKSGIDKGQSPYHILTNNENKIHCSVRTAYRIIDAGKTIVQNIDLRRKCKLKPRKKYNYNKDKTKVREGRSYVDFIKYYADNPGIGIVEIDTVEGIKGEDEKVLLTIHFTASHFMMAILLDSKTKENVTNAFINLQKLLGKETYSKLFPIILTDRGEEFVNPLSIETYYENGEIVSRVFFCDSYSSFQKGAIEENHTLVRYVIPKGISLNFLTQDKVDLMLSHINSYSRQSISSTPYILFEILYGEETLKKVRIISIDPNSVTLKPNLLK